MAPGDANVSGHTSGVQSIMQAKMVVLWIDMCLPSKKAERNSMILFSWSSSRKAYSLGEVD